MAMIPLENRVVVITGATGGLGQALCREFLGAGSIVAGLARNQPALDDLASSLGSDQFVPVAVDVSDPVAVEDRFDHLARSQGRIDFLFNNAAVYPRVNFLEESHDAFLDAILINIGGVSNCCKSALKRMCSQGFGRIYNLGSFADIMPIPSSAAYSCSKGALHALTKGIAADVSSLDADIEVHEWIPGHLNTRMSDFTGIDPAVSASWGARIAAGDIPASGKCVIFENDHEWTPPKSLKRRIREKLLFWR